MTLIHDASMKDDHNRKENKMRTFQDRSSKTVGRRRKILRTRLSNQIQDRGAPPNSPVAGDEIFRSPGGLPNPAKGAGWILEGTGLPMSPGTMLPRWPVTALLGSGSNRTNLPPGSSLIEKEPPPLCGLPSVSQISSISSNEIDGSFLLRSWSTCPRTRFTSWKLPVLWGLVSESRCLQACMTSKRIVTGRDVCGR